MAADLFPEGCRADQSTSSWSAREPVRTLATHDGDFNGGVTVENDPQSATVEVCHLYKKFGEHTVLNDINIVIEEGEILAIMGSSGGGKTTFLRCISGLLEPSSGEVLVAGIDLHKEPEQARNNMGMVFQGAALFDSLSVSDNVSFGLVRKLKHRQEKEIAKRTIYALQRVGLQDDGDKMPSEISGGMRKRVGIARALILEPKVMLYDEPTTGLDPITTYAIDHLIVDLRRERRMTSILVSHDLSSVLRTADRIAFLHEGSMIFVGKPTDFMHNDHPAIQEIVTKSRATSFEFGLEDELADSSIKA